MHRKPHSRNRTRRRYSPRHGTTPGRIVMTLVAIAIPLVLMTAR